MFFFLGPYHPHNADASFWETALSMALCSQLAYQPAGVVVHIARNKLSLDTCDFIEAGDTQCVVAASSDAIVVAFRGTESLADWIADLKLFGTSRSYGTVHSGFCTAFELVRDAVRRRIEQLASSDRKLLLTGHSLGGALAVVAAADMWTDFPADAIYTFGQPRVGKGDFAAFGNQRFSSRFYRFVNDDDVVTRVPPGFQHFGTLFHFDENGQLRNQMTESVAADTESPALTEQQFRELQRSIEETREVARETKTSDAEAEAAVSATVEGLFPSFSDHRLDRYIAIIRRFTVGPTEMRVDRTLEISRELRAADSATEAVRSSFSGNHSREGTPVLLRLRSVDWEPPAGLRIQSRVGVFVTARADDKHLARLKADPHVLSIEASRDAGVHDCGVSMPFVRVPEVHLPPTGEQGERGDKAIVGLIDSGIDVLHEAFLDAGGQTRILAIWNQREACSPVSTPRGVDPRTFSQEYGRYYGSDEIRTIVERGRQGHNASISAVLRDPNQDPLGNPQPGHGTHVASIAAGRAVGTFAGGVAPDAKLIVVIPNMVTSPGSPPSLGYSNSHIDAIVFLRSAALKEALPMVINVSLGMNAGAHDGLSNLEATFDALTDKGKIPGFVIVKSAGNEGGSGGHAEVQAVASVKTISWDSANRFRRQDYIEVWYDEWQDLEFALLDPQGNRSPTVSVAAPVANAALGGNVCMLALRFPHPDNGHHLLQITIIPDSTAIQAGKWTLEIVGTSVAGARPMIHAWVERDQSRSVRFLTGDCNAMTISVPGTAEHVITVGACGSSLPIRVPAFSSQGLTRDGRPKPDLCAPGEMVVAAASNSADSQAVVAMPGTSMAAPHVAGAIALALSLREKSGKPQLNANQLKAALKRTTKGANGIHDREFGFGALDVATFIQHVKQLP